MSDDPQDVERRQVSASRNSRDTEWDFLADPSETPRYAAVARYVHSFAPRGRVLDVGCGEGLLLNYLDLTRIDYHGFDISIAAIDRALRRHQNMSLFIASIEDYAPKDSQTFDVIIFNEVLAQANNPMVSLMRYYQFLKPSGHVIVSQYQSKPGSRAGLVSGALQNEVAAGRVRVVAESEVRNFVAGLRWKVYCFANETARQGEVLPEHEPLR
jgi:2-polyprenyl-3-methyl-5-hydroxy-6-metoxy-1,4-benzoquinol methylase